MTPIPEDDASPVDELRKKLWRDRIKPWLDIRSYLRQRTIILRHPALDFPPETTTSADWKTPLTFAIQGTVIIAFLVGFVGKVFSKFIEPRPMLIYRIERNVTGTEINFIPMRGPTSWTERQKFIKEKIETLQTELRVIRQDTQKESFNLPVSYSLIDNPNHFLLGESIKEEVPKEDAIHAYEQEIATLNNQLYRATLAPYKEEAWKTIRSSFVAIVLVLSAYLFRLSINFRRPPEIAPYQNAHRVYLYFVTASLFWVNLAYALLSAVRENVEKFFPPSFNYMVHDLDRTLRSIDDSSISINPSYFTSRDFVEVSFTLATVAIIIWAYLIIRRIARQLRPTLRLPQPIKRWGIYSGEKKIRKDIIAANLASSIAILLISSIVIYVYAVISSRIPKL